MGRIDRKIKKQFDGRLNRKKMKKQNRWMVRQIGEKNGGLDAYK